MDRNGIVGTVVLLLLILSDVSKASFVWKLRQLAAVAPTHGNSSSPSSSPTLDPSQIVGNGSGSGNTGNTSQDVPKVVDSDSKGLSNNNNDDTTTNEKAGPSPSQTHKDKEDTHTDQSTTKKDELNNTKKKNRDNTNDAEEAKTPIEPGPAENCNGAASTCTVRDSFLVACILNFYPGSNEFVILVQNEGEGTLKVNLTAPNASDLAPFEIPKHKNRKMNLTVGNGSKVILRTETGYCELQTHPVSQGNSFLRFPSTDKLITPVNGAYFLIFTVIVFGGSFACFMFRRRRQQGGGIPYQELEMASPESSSTNHVDSAEGWDQDWDDDWDEENAMKSPAGPRAGSISANGLTSRSSNKDSWENSWDD